MPYACPINGKGTQLNISAAPSRVSTPHSDGSRKPSATQLGDENNAPNSAPVTPPRQSRADGDAKPHRGMFILNDDDDDEDETYDESQMSSSHITIQAPPPSSTPIKTPQAVRRLSPQQPGEHHTSPLRRAYSRKNQAASGISKITFNRSDILRFPKESTHAYSYAHLSPNSLAVRLSVLKRSLEILLDRPELMNLKSYVQTGPSTNGLDLDIGTFISQIQNETAKDVDVASPVSKNLNIRSNASSAALAALFNDHKNNSQPPANSKSDNHDSDANEGIKNLINILQEDELSDTSSKNLAQNLHDLSLATGDSSKSLESRSQLKVKMLHALATPFYEPIIDTPIIPFNKGGSSLALSALAKESVVSQGSNERVFHNVSQRNNSPQAVFTCELNDPWNLKAANDLACLIFGVSKASLRRLTLLDLIAPDARDFVLNKLIENSMTNDEMIFAGEVVAIAKRGTKLTWSSLWAKKKGNLIICMFDQVPCDSVDLIYNAEENKIMSTKSISGCFFNYVSQCSTVGDLVEKFDETTQIDNEDTNVPLAVMKAQLANDQRYFTVKKNGYNVPCALTSKVIDENEGRVKIRIHTMPYIAGVFIVSRSNYSVLSFNNSVSKNLFGYSERQLTNCSVDKIIPKFSKMMKYIFKNMPRLKIMPGLVLPEHFFRQVDSNLENTGEEGFLTSLGLNGLHSDGSTIKIDVQLRCTNSDTFVLWVTHSRTLYGGSLQRKVDFKLDTGSEDEESVKAPHGPFDAEVVDKSEDELPSQLSILNVNEIQTVSRTSSMRSTTVSSSTQSSNLSTTDNSEVDIGQLVNPQVGSEAKSDSKTDLTRYKMLDQKLDELELLKLENDAIEKRKTVSRHYPRVIGSKRREKSFNEYKILKKMGQGAYGRVVLAENKEDPNYIVVIKLIIKERILVDTWVRDRKLGTIPSEIQVMATLNKNPHPNIMRLIDFFEDDDYYYIELPPHGYPIPAIDLFDFIELKKDMSELECKSIMKQSISAINHLHNNGIVHRDIKDENLIIDANGVIKLIDFGSAAYIKQGPFDVFVGTLDYAAPEVLNGLPYEGKPQDVWSLGILLYTLIYKENPFYNVDEIMEGELRIPFVTSEGCLSLIKRILQRDIRKRPAMKDIVVDPWLVE